MATLRWQEGLQLEVAKRIVTAARKVAPDHSAALVLCGIAAGGCKTHCNSCTKRRLWLQKLQLAGRQLRASSPNKWLLREEVAERRGV